MLWIDHLPNLFEKKTTRNAHESSFKNHKSSSSDDLKKIRSATFNRERLDAKHTKKFHVGVQISYFFSHIVAVESSHSPPHINASEAK